MTIKRLNVLGEFLSVIMTGIVIFYVSFILLDLEKGTNDDVVQRMNEQHQYDKTIRGPLNAIIHPPHHTVPIRPRDASKYSLLHNVTLVKI